VSLYTAESVWLFFHQLFCPNNLSSFCGTNIPVLKAALTL
jgi:hypothetical protein